jgi:SRSO17 transposase
LIPTLTPPQDAASWQAHARQQTTRCGGCEPYLPAEWATDQGRREEAGVPENVALATKPELARRMLERLRAAGLPAAWVTGGTV